MEPWVFAATHSGARVHNLGTKLKSVIFFKVCYLKSQYIKQRQYFLFYVSQDIIITYYSTNQCMFEVGVYEQQNVLY